MSEEKETESRWNKQNTTSKMGNLNANINNRIKHKQFKQSNLKGETIILD